MNKLLTGILVLALATGTAVTGQATEPTTAQHAHDHATAAAVAPTAGVVVPETEGEIRKVDAAAQKLTVKHGRIENLGMSPMTMVFRVKDPAFLTQVKPGDKIKMTVERIDGALTIVALQRVP
jgi:Cu/Ag efflux protein CusF